MYLLVTAIISGCASTQPKFGEHLSKSKEHWFAAILNYENTLPSDHPHRIESLFEIDPSITSLVRERFQHSDKHRRAKRLTDWLTAEDGHNMVYDLNANFAPQQAFTQKRGNCLSFTMLVVTLANDLGINLEYNDVDLPDIWGLDENTGFIYYRHINAIFKSPNKTQVFDLAIDDYDAAFPQRTISERSAGALLHSNLGVEALKKNELELASHHLKLAVSIDPVNPQLWINLGATYKRQGNHPRAEAVYLTALELDDYNSIAASNLERLYRELGQNNKADRYQKIAAKARNNNPYALYQKAKDHLAEKKPRLARKAIKRAIRLHKKDSRFFALSSQINQAQKRYKSALFDLEKAHNLSRDTDKRQYYIDQVKLVAKLLEKETIKREEARASARNRNVLVRPSNTNF